MKTPMPKIFIQLFTAAFVAVFASHAFAEIKTEEISYRLKDVELNGYMAWDDSIKEKRPGVLVVHEWWGHNEYARKRARDLAKEGYVAFALDMYGDNKLAQHPKDAEKFMNEIMPRYDEMLERFYAAKKQLRRSKFVEKDKILAIGYCFGGAVVLNVARSESKRDKDLAGVVSFHGSLGAVRKSDTAISTPILVLNGADDPFISSESIEVFKNEMNKRKADYEFISYPGAKHSFTNPGATEVGEKFGIPLEYNKEVDEQSWKAMLGFFDKSLNLQQETKQDAKQ